MDDKYQKQLENIVDWTKELVAENTLLWAVVAAAKMLHHMDDVKPGECVVCDALADLDQPGLNSND